MRFAIKIFLFSCFLGSVFMLPDYSSEIKFEDSEIIPTTASEGLIDTEEVTTVGDELLQNETTEESTSVTSTENVETDEVCTCCPILPTILDESTIVENIKKQLKEDLVKIEEEFIAKKVELQSRIKKLSDEAEPNKLKLREVRKANRDKETELKIEEISEKSSALRTNFKELINKVIDLSDSRLVIKKDYQEGKNDCRNRKGREAYDEDDECQEYLAKKMGKIDEVNADISSALEEMKTKHDEIVEVEKQLKVAEDELWTTIYENRKKIEDNVEKVTVSYMQISIVKGKLEKLGEKYEANQRTLQAQAKNELKKFSPSKYSWLSWSNYRSEVPTNALIGGYDLDKTILYVIRYQKDDGTYEYGKFSNKRLNAYVTRGDDEKIVYDFDLLVGDNFNWCSNSALTNNEPSKDIPICRAKISDSLAPGTFLSNGRCRAGFGFSSFYKDDDFEVLKQGKC